MECRYTKGSYGNKKVVFFDCVACGKEKGIENENCMQATLRALKGCGDVEQLQFRQKNYILFYDSKGIERLSEVSDVARRLQLEKLWGKIVDCKRSHRDWRFFVKNLIEKELSKDPFKAYDMVSSVIEQYRKIRLKHDTGCLKNYLEVLLDIKKRLESTWLIKGHLQGFGIQEMLRPLRQPSFITAPVNFELSGDSIPLDRYSVGDSSVEIHEVDGLEKIYFIKPPEIFLSQQDVEVLVCVKDEILKESIKEVIDPLEARKRFKDMGLDLLNKRTEYDREHANLEKLADIFARYTAGYGLLETLFLDERIHDIYIDSPAGACPVYIDHDSYGVCNTNIFLSEDELERISSKFRAIGGRPFDEANPIMDMELKDIGVRVAGIREPATFDGIAYSFRKRRERPWTLPRFVEEKMMSSKTAALLSLIVSGKQSILITGARGSGKTSLLSALIAEINQSDRIVLMEDTPELPSRSLRGLGWRIEHLRNQPVISRRNDSSYELSPEENLRAALRLGESVLILGEVRGPEAKSLFEAMRVGAAGNAVLGTIHGSSPYDTWDRITNDLGVPPTSFKAVDIVVSVGYRENRELSRKERYVKSITEVRKEWEKNPQLENGFFDVMKYDPVKGCEVYTIEESEMLQGIALRKGMTPEECKKNLVFREKMIDDLIKASSRGQDLLEIREVVCAKKEYIRLMNLQTRKEGIIDYERLYSDWGMWLEEYCKGARKSAPLPSRTSP